MADPISLLGTIPTLLTLPAACLQAINTISGLWSSVRHAPNDIQALLSDVEGTTPLLETIQSRCYGSITGSLTSQHQDLLRRVLEPLQQDLTSLSDILQTMKDELNKPSRSSLNIRARLRKYFSEEDVKARRSRLSEQKLTLQIALQNITFEMLDSVLHNQRMFQEQTIGLLQQLSAQRMPLTITPSTEHVAPLLDTTGPIIQSRRRKTQKKSRCRSGICGCQCHRHSSDAYSWLLVRPSVLFRRCDCDDKLYEWKFSIFQKIVRFQFAIRSYAAANISCSLSFSTLVRHTSAGFVVLEKCKIGLLTPVEASQMMGRLLASREICVNDFNQSGDGYVDSITRWMWRIPLRGRQFELLKLLVNQGFILDSNKSLRHFQMWIGEGPHMWLLEEILHLGLDPSEVAAEVLASWPLPMQPGYLSPYDYEDIFNVKAMGILGMNDPGFGGMTVLQDAVLTNNFEAVRATTAQSPELMLEANFLGQSPLHLSILSDEMVQELTSNAFDLDEDLDIADNYGVTPLMYAVTYGNLNATKTLLRAGANPWLRDKLRGFCTWHYAMFCNKPRFIEQIIEFHQTLDSEEAEMIRSYCCWIRATDTRACMQDSYGVFLSWLLRPGKIVERVTNLGNTILHLCNNPYDAQILLSHPWATINNKNKRGYTALMAFSRFQDATVLKLAISRGAQLEPTDEHGMNALHHLNAQFACVYRRIKDVVYLKRWMESVSVLVSGGVSVCSGDLCICPCSVRGCSPVRSFFWKDDGSSAFDKDMLRRIPWLLELVLMLSSRSVGDLKTAMSDCHRLIRFSEMGLSHTCSTHGRRFDYQQGLRPRRCFQEPHEDECKDSVEGDSSADWNDELANITTEQEELASALDKDCEEYLIGLEDDYEQVWANLLARYAVLLEHKLGNHFEKIQAASPRVTQSTDDFEKPIEANIIRVNTSAHRPSSTRSPLRYIDKDSDQFVDSWNFSSCNWNELEKTDCNVEPHVQAFLEHSNEILPSRQGAEADRIQRHYLAQIFMEKVQQLRQVPLEDRGWDLDVVLG